MENFLEVIKTMDIRYNYLIAGMSLFSRLSGSFG
jgi:hypothetical protein